MTEREPSILVTDEVTEKQRAAIIQPLGDFSAARGFVFRPAPLCLVLQQGDDIVGGLIAHTNWNWLYIEVLSIATHLRSHGYGRQLVERAEEMARTRNCIGAWVDTYSFQSPGFYQRLGYSVFGTLPRYPGVEQRIFLMKAF